MEASHPAPPPVTTARTGRPFVIVLLLALGVWASALIPRDEFTHNSRTFYVTAGSATDLAGVIRSAPRAIVFVDEQTSTYSAAGRIKFLEDARRLARDHGSLGVRFFLVERQYAPETRVWLDGLRDERLDLLGRRMKGYGGLIWLEYGRVVEADDSVARGAPTRTWWGGRWRCGEAGGDDPHNPGAPATDWFRAVRLRAMPNWATSCPSRRSS